jgi:ATP-binding cassette subfamily B protein/subfamily B ATP-binding cassette protein MsbA
LARWFWRTYLHHQKGLLFLAFLIMVIEGSTLGALSYMLEPLFDQVFGAGRETSLWPIGLMIFGLFALRGVTSLVSKTLMARIGQQVAARMQADLLRHILTLDMGFFQEHAPGKLIERVQGDTLAVQGIWAALLMGVGRDFVSLIGLFAVALSIDPWWTLAALVGTPLLILPAAILRNYVRRKAVQLREQAGERATRLDEIFHGIQAVKLNRMEVHQEGRFTQILNRIVTAETKAAAGRAVMPSLVDIITGVGFLAVLLLGGREVAAGNRTTGEFMAFFSAMVLTFQPLRRLSEMAGLWQMAYASLMRITGLLATRSALHRPARSAAAVAPLPPPIRFEDVHFGYGEQPVLTGLSFTAEAGRMTALVGPSGAGKTTVFHLLTGLADPDRGRILLGDLATTDLAIDDQRQLFATVSQDSALFDEPLRENLLVGQADVSDDRVARALATAQAGDFVAALPQGLDTPAGPRGSVLSGGQRQRIAIARALLRDAPILLLDEATSALDAASETALSEALDSAGADRTTIVIAHRLATIRRAHKIVVMDKGRAVETGTHDELLARGGLYARLHALQFKDDDQKE